MPAPRRLLVAALLLPLLLTGCVPEAPPVPLPEPEEVTPTPTEEAIQLPEDSVMAVTGTATAANGAALSLRLIVHEPYSYDAPEVAAGQARLLDWCDGELDLGYLQSGNFSIVPVDYSATEVGTTAWPKDDSIWLHPIPIPLVSAPTGSIVPVELGVDPSDPGDYVPHCLQNATLPGAGEGIVYLAIEGDTAGTDQFPILRAWSSLTYGFTNSFKEGAEAGIHFADCETTITALGTEFGAPGPGWHEDFQNGSCIVGGTTGE